MIQKTLKAVFLGLFVFIPLFFAIGAHQKEYENKIIPETEIESVFKSDSQFTVAIIEDKDVIFKKLPWYATIKVKITDKKPYYQCDLKMKIYAGINKSKGDCIIYINNLDNIKNES